MTIKNYLIELFLLKCLKEYNIIWCCRNIKTKFIVEYEYILKVTTYLSINCKFSERIFHILNNLTYVPLCIECRIKTPIFVSFNEGYNTYCSITCSNKSKIKKNITRKNNIRKYGVDNLSKLERVKEKNKQTCLDKYGVDSYLKTKKFKDKYKQTCLNKYGVEYPIQSDEFKDKYKQTCLNKYGVNNVSKLNQITDKKKKTCLDKYGVDSYSKTKECRDKFKQTCLDKYGVDNPFKVNSIKEHIIKYNQERFGEEYYTQTDDFKVKRTKTCLDKYGVDSYSKTEEFKDKCKQTCIKKYNEQHPMKVMDIKNHSIEVFSRSEFMNDFRIKRDIFLKENNLEIIGTYHSEYFKSRWKCTKCDEEFIQVWASINQGYKCPNCYPRNFSTSLAEKELLELIKSLINYEVIENDRKILEGKELDIYIPDMNLAFEYNGLYWHSEECLVDKSYHINKTIKCKENKIRLIHIFEDEWLFKNDIVKHRIKQILGVNNSNRIHARKCVIKEIESNIKNNFLEKYHLQGRDSSKIKLGAFYNNELVSVMTFSHGNISKGSTPKTGIWELNRFCSDYNYHIPGIAGKLLSHFKRNQQWKEIFSYADRRWSEGNLYNMLGFNLEKETGINYWYIKNYRREHRFSHRKRFDEPKDIPEWKLRQNEGLFRIWDCGNLKFKMENNNGFA